MFLNNKAARLQKIREITKEMQQVSVAFLSNALNVSEPTVRSNLEELEKEGFLTRFHGGATLNSKEPVISRSELIYPEITNPKEKNIIGELAAATISNRQGIFFGPGTTNYYAALALRKRTDLNVNVVTNNFYVAHALRGCGNFRLQFIGGTTPFDGYYTISDNLEEILANHYFDKVFFSTDAVSLTSGYTLSDPVAFDIITKASLHSKEKVALLDSTKFDRQSFIKVGDLNFAQTFITDGPVPDHYSEQFRLYDVGIITPATA